MSKKYLLTGAGFSKSFGALLCSELTAIFFNSLIQEKEIQKEIINRADLHNFEQILSEIRKSYPDKIGTIQKILEDIFRQMQSNMNHRHELPNQTNFQENSVAHFFWKFDCIFTLNQDSFSDMKKDKFSTRFGDHHPNMAFSNQRNSDKLSLKNGNNIPYIELHGAYDWKDVFILGSNKEEEIQSRPQIKKFHEFFEKSLCENGSKLVIIGYSFCDSHINKIIHKGIERGLEIFIWDPGVLNILNGIKSNTIDGGWLTYDDFLPEVKKDDLRKTLRGYLPKNFILTGNDKEHIYRFLDS